MTIKVSTGLRNSMLDTESFKASLDDGYMRIYGGAEPASADDAESATVLVDITDASQVLGAGTGIDFAASAAAGVLSKDGVQVWSGVISTGGTATHFRLLEQADGGGSSSTDKRVQGSIGTAGADLNLSSVALVATATQTIDAFSVTLPTL